MIKERGFTMQLKKRLDNMVMFFEYLLMKNDFVWCLWMFITLFLHITIFLFLSPAILLFIAYSAILYGILKYNNENSITHKINNSIFCTLWILSMPWELTN